MFQALGRQLLFSYIGVTVTIWGMSTLAVYQFLSYNLYQKLDREIVNLANAAAHNLLAMKAETKAIDRRIPRIVDDDDGDLDIPWQDLRENHQGVEWFDANGQLLGKAGKHIPQTSVTPNFRIVQQKKIRSITIPVYSHNLVAGKKWLQGYVRVSESTEELEEDLENLLWGFAWGGLIVIVLGTIGGWWLTRQSLKPIKQSFQQLKQFTADASHELRSPLTAVKTSVEVLMNHPERIHPADVKKLEAIASATDQMTRLVEDLLLLARSDAATATSVIPWMYIPLDELLEDLLELFKPQAEAIGITLKSEISKEVLIKGDAIQLKRLFSNLLQNALQYTAAGGNVTVSIVNHEQFVVVKVKDTGIGIAQEHIPLIFNRFWRADQARSQREGGLGLGLAIADAIAQTHGGNITVSSEVGVGSCFQVSLPLERTKINRTYVQNP